MKVIFFDTETTGVSDVDRLCQLAIKERGIAEALHYNLYRPPLAIPYGASRIHGITDDMVADKPLFTEAPDYGELKDLFQHEETVAVAHNASFDTGMLSREGIVPVNVVCTFKVARALDPKHFLPSYSLQDLRRALSINIEARAHDALGDVLVLEKLFERLFAKLMTEKGDEKAALDAMMTITREPVLFTTFRFGKHNGRKIEDVLEDDPGYLEWLLSKKKENPEGEADWIYTLEHYLKSDRAPF